MVERPLANHEFSSLFFPLDSPTLNRSSTQLRVSLIAAKKIHSLTFSFTGFEISTSCFSFFSFLFFSLLKRYVAVGLAEENFFFFLCPFRSQFVSVFMERGRLKRNLDWDGIASNCPRCCWLLLLHATPLGVCVSVWVCECVCVAALCVKAHRA